VRDGHASAVLAASIFHFGQHSVAEAKRTWPRRGSPMRSSRDGMTALDLDRLDPVSRSFADISRSGGRVDGVPARGHAILS
jgi:hypothetical protein